MSAEVKIKEYEEIRQMDDETLVKEFEDFVRKGVGSSFIKVIWMRKEILKRMKH